MATMTITYNGRSRRAKLALEMLFSTGLFQKKDKPNARTIAAIKEAKSGKSTGVVDITDMDAMIRSMQ